MKEAYKSMCDALTPLGLYSFESTNVNKELLTYAVAIDELNNMLNDLLCDCFIDSATDFGLSQRELVIGAVRDDLSVDKRRSMLKLRESISLSSFTPSEIKKSLESFGLTCEVYEFPTLYITVVDATGKYTTAQKAWIRSQVEKIMPAHLQVQVVFNGPSWAQIDENDNNFSYMNIKNYTWEQIDNLE